MAIKLGAEYKVTLPGCEHLRGKAVSYKHNLDGSTEVFLAKERKPQKHEWTIAELAQMGPWEPPEQSPGWFDEEYVEEVDNGTDKDVA